ncbi:Ribonuclease M5 [[Mycoplasma] cavipharyngis]|uniref:ribonuclease M5 n=1 Tax=[Mycoplasma] cavipharyngis TaxID=92757 RepID=UPI003703F317
MKLKIKLDCVFVVEGKTDTNLLKTFFDVATIETNGSALTWRTLNLIKKVKAKRDVILLLDPDYQGQKIQKRILEQIPDCQVCHFSKKDLNPEKTKTGIAEVDIIKLKTKIIDFLANQKMSKNNSQEISWNQYLDLNLTTKLKRQKVCDYFQIPYFNHKNLFKNLQLLSLSLAEIKQAINYE